MKAKFFAVAALMLGLASCQTDFDGVRGNAGGEVDFQLKVDAAELGATRADQDGRNGHDSAFGAIDYLTEADWNNVDLRYSLEVYEVKNNVVSDVPVKDRMVQIVDQYAPVTFDLRLIPSREYRFVVFADFVPEDSTAEVEGETLTDHNSDLGLYHTIGANLRDIKVVNDALFTECADAYFAFEDITINNAEPHSLVLKRPYGKLRVVATDLAEINTNINPAKVVVRYDAIHPAAFNAVTGEIAEEIEDDAEYSYEYAEVGTESLANHYYTKGYDAETIVTAENKTRHTHMTLFTDYILAEDDQRGVHFTLEVWDNNGELIKSTDFDTEIPVQRNHLTTIIGNVMTTATEINVTIDDNFANENRQYYVFEAFTNVDGFEQGINDGVVTLDRDYVIGQTIYVRSGINATLNLNGFSIKNAKENEYTDVIYVEEGASLTINGEGLIEAVSGNNGYAVIAEGKVTINGGTFKAGKDENGEANAVVYARGNGEVYVNGGYFPNDANSTYVLNKKDADRATTVIEVRGGKFEYFDPMNNAAENAGTNFVADGFASFLEGEHTYVVRPTKDYEINEEDKIVYAYSANGLLKWSWLVANNDPTWSVKLMANITMPMFTVEEDAANDTYKYTTTPVTITDNKPSASNWVQVGTYAPYNVYYDALVDGNGYTISNLAMYSEHIVTGFIGYCENVEVCDLTFNNATIYSTSSYVASLSYMLDGSYIHNVHVKNSYFRGTSNVAGIVAEAMDHYDDPDKTYVHEFMDGTRQKLMPLVTLENCTTDGYTTIVGTSERIGGIAAEGYGCMIINCHNKANITGNGYVGGIAGYFRDYYHNQFGYIVNCSSTDCTIKSSGARVGGIAGYVMEGHNGSAWVVGCYSNSTIECTKSNVGSIVGYLSGTNEIVGNYAISTLKVSGYGSAGNTSFSFASASDITADAIAKMNEGIAKYNAFAAGYAFPESPVSLMPMELPSCPTW